MEKLPWHTLNEKNTEQYISNMIFIKKAKNYYLYMTLKARDKW